MKRFHLLPRLQAGADLVGLSVIVLEQKAHFSFPHQVVDYIDQKEQPERRYDKHKTRLTNRQLMPIAFNERKPAMVEPRYNVLYKFTKSHVAATGSHTHLGAWFGPFPMAWSKLIRLHKYRLGQ